MKTRNLFTLALAGLMAVVLAGSVQAQKTDKTGERRNLFQTAGPKQTNKDFKPARIR